MPDRLPPASCQSELVGRTVVVTRASHQAAPVAELLRQQGAKPVIAPAVAVVPPLDGGQSLDDALLRLHQFSWVAFSSSNAVAATFARADRRGARNSFERLSVAAVGPSTAARIRAELGRPADLVPDQHDGAGLAVSFADPDPLDACFVPQSAGARPDLVAGLRARGWNVTAVSAYRTVTPTLSDHITAELARADAVIFASPSALRGHLQQTGGAPVSGQVICIGRTTAAACASAGVTVAAIAPQPSDAGILEAVASALARLGKC